MLMHLNMGKETESGMSLEVVGQDLEHLQWTHQILSVSHEYMACHESCTTPKEPQPTGPHFNIISQNN